MAAPIPEAQMPLPPRIQNAHEFPLLPQQPPILVNAFKMDLSKIVPNAFLFDLKFFAFSANRQNPQGKENSWELWKDEKNDIDVQIRRRLLWHLFELLFEVDPGTFQPQYRPHYIYDCRNLMFCSDNIGFEVNQEWTIQIGRQHLDGLPAELLSHPDIRNAIRVEAIVLRTKVTLNLHNELMQNEETLIQMLEILVSQRIMQLDEHLIFGSVIFSQTLGQAA